jgi:hypothetical protein
MPSNQRLTGKMLNKEWGVGASHALYFKRGDWFHLLERFPAALFDPYGYVRFETPKELRGHPGLQIGKHIHVPGGISCLKGYVQVVRR